MRHPSTGARRSDCIIPSLQDLRSGNNKWGLKRPDYPSGRLSSTTAPSNQPWKIIYDDRGSSQSSIPHLAGYRQGRAFQCAANNPAIPWEGGYLSWINGSLPSEQPLIGSWLPRIGFDKVNIRPHGVLVRLFSSSLLQIQARWNSAPTSSMKKKSPCGQSRPACEHRLYAQPLGFLATLHRREESHRSKHWNTLATRRVNT
ncbi:hypothetical protein NMY22_g19701 [Coprinellus aureogranulatus]|nr:hypothetical protein NMY22_g19701 [Coprinellus aureogranulatus]